MTYYQATKSIRARNHMLVLDIPEKIVHLKFRSYTDVQKLLKKVPFYFDEDFKDLTIPQKEKSKIMDKINKIRGSATCKQKDKNKIKN